MIAILRLRCRIATFLFSTAILLGGCPVGPAGDAGDSTNDADAAARLLVRDDDHVKSTGAPTVTVIEYGDFQCSVCGRFFRETYPAILSEYVDAGRVRWVFRHFPLRSVHANAEITAQASECAGPDAFWDMHDRLFENQSDLSKSALLVYAAAAGLNAAEFETCLDSGSSAARVQTDVDLGTVAGVSGTPTFFVNGTAVVGFRSVEEFRAILDAALADAATADAATTNGATATAP